MQSAFPAEATFFVTPERRGGVEFVIRIGPDYPGVQFFRQVENLRAFVSPNPGGQSIGRVVCLVDYQAAI